MNRPVTLMFHDKADDIQDKQENHLMTIMQQGNVKYMY